MYPNNAGRTSRFSEAQRRHILDLNEKSGVPIAELARRFGIHPVTVYQWRAMRSKSDQFNNESPAGFSIKEVQEELSRLREENRKLRHSVSEIALDNSCLKDVIEAFKKRGISLTEERLSTSSASLVSIPSPEYAESSDTADKPITSSTLPKRPR